MLAIHCDIKKGGYVNYFHTFVHCCLCLGLAERFAKLRNEYGEISSYHILGKRIIVLNSHAVAKEALIGQGEVFDGRPTLNPFIKVMKEFGISNFLNLPCLIFGLPDNDEQFLYLFLISNTYIF